MKTTLFLLLSCLAASGLAQMPRLVVPVGHTDIINSVAFSPDGKYVLTGSDDQMAKLWDVQTGREIQTFRGHSKEVNSVAFSPDGKSILTGSADSTAKLWSVGGQEIRTFGGHSDAIESVAFSPDGKYVLTGSYDNTAKLWSLVGQEIHTFSDHSDGVLSVAFSPDGKSILTSGGDNTAKLWSIAGQEIRTFSNHSDEVNSVAFSPDGKYVLTGSDDKTAKLWDVQTGREIQTFGGHSSGVKSVAFSPDGKSILTGSADATAKLWSIDSQETHTFSGHRDGVLSVAFSPDGKSILGSAGNTAKLWSVAGQEVRTFGGHSSSVRSVAFSPDGKSILTGSADGTAKLWSVAGQEIRTFSGHSNGVKSVAFSPDGKYVLTGSDDNTAKLWSVVGQEIRTFSGHSFGVKSVAFSPDGKSILTGSADATAKLWSIAGPEINTFDGGGNSIWSVAFSPDGKSILTGGWDGTAKLWSVEGQEINTFGSGEFGVAVASVAFSPDGKYVLMGRDDKTAELWSVEGQEINTFDGGGNSIWSVAFSPDGKSILTGSEDGTAKLWSVSGQEIHTFSGHSGCVMSVAFSPDWKSILTGSLDNTTKLWDTKTGQCLATLIAIDSIDWVVTTSSGLFDASPGAMNLMYYVQGLEVIDLEQLKGRYWEPGLLSKIMGFSKGALRNVSAFGTLPLYPEIKAFITGDRLHVDLVERSGGMGRLSLSVNGKEKMPDANPGKKTSLDIELKQFALDLLPDGNTIALRSYIAGDGWLKSQDYELPYIPGGASKGEGQGDGSPEPKPAGGGPRPEFYGIIVGTSQYESPDLKLSFPDGDALAMEQALRAVSTAWLGAGRVHIRRLTTDAKTPADMADKVNIAATFRDYAAQAKSTDILMVFFSGHGKTYTANGVSNFYYLTKDMRSMEELGDAGVRGRFAISDEELGQWLIDNHAQRQVLIFDACNSGTVVQNIPATGARELNSSQIRANDLLKDRTGTFILAGAAADKVSFEASKYDQGLLTRSLLEGMSGLALDEDRVDVAKLFEYACRKVPELAADVNQVQKPVPFFPKGGSFPIGIKDASVQIHLRPGKPVIIRNNFQDDSFGDALGLTKALEQYFLDLTVRPAEAEVSYIPVNEYNDEAYSIRGSYSVNGDAVEVHGRLFKGKTKLGVANFTVNGLKSDVPGLAKKIVDAVWGMVK